MFLQGEPVGSVPVCIQESAHEGVVSGLVVISMTAQSESHRSAGIGGVRANAIRVTLVHRRSFVWLAGTRRIDLVVLYFGCGRRPIGYGLRPAYSG